MTHRLALLGLPVDQNCMKKAATEKKSVTASIIELCRTADD